MSEPTPGTVGGASGSKTTRARSGSFKNTQAFMGTIPRMRSEYLAAKYSANMPPSESPVKKVWLVRCCNQVRPASIEEIQSEAVLLA